MLVLSIRTDKPEAELGLFDDAQKLVYEQWSAHRQLAETIHDKLKTLLADQHISLEELGGIVVFKGPGSFTGLRIGLSVANGLAYGLKLPIVGTTGDYWIAAGCERLQRGQSEQVVAPDYGAEPHITAQKK